MPRHEFACSECDRSEEVDATFEQGPPEPWPCECGGLFEKVWNQVLFSVPGGADPNYISPYDAVSETPLRPVYAAEAKRKERAYAQDLENKRRMARDAGAARGPMKMTHSVPAHLWHGKIRQTGDKNYWDDPKNRKRHDSVTKIT